MPAPPKLFLTLLYKLEGPQPDDFTVALEVTTWDSGICLEGNPTSLPGEDSVPPVLSAVSTCCGVWDQLSPSPPDLAPSSRAQRPALSPVPAGTAAQPRQAARHLPPWLPWLDQPVSALPASCVHR